MLAASRIILSDTARRSPQCCTSGQAWVTTLLALSSTSDEMYLATSTPRSSKALLAPPIPSHKLINMIESLATATLVLISFWNAAPPAAVKVLPTHAPPPHSEASETVTSPDTLALRSMRSRGQMPIILISSWPTSRGSP